MLKYLNVKIRRKTGNKARIYEDTVMGIFVVLKRTQDQAKDYQWKC